MFSMIFRLAKAYLLYRIGKSVLGENGGSDPKRTTPSARRKTAR